MTTHSFQLTEDLSKISEFPQTPSPQLSASLPEQSFNQAIHSSRENQTRSNLKRTYFLERRCFL